MLAIVVQTFVSAPAEPVWEALVERSDLVLDSLPARDAWPESGRSEQAPRRLEVMWDVRGHVTRAGVTLHDVGDGVRVDLRHEGWPEGPEWEAQVQGHFAGWLQGLAVLGHYVETGGDARVADPALAGTERYFISGEIPRASADAVYRCLTDHDALARWSDGVLDGMTVIESVDDRLVRWRTPSGSELVAVLRPTPRGTHAALAEYGVRDRSASAKWPAAFERLARFLQ